MAGIAQAIVETFPNNCTIMFPQAPSSTESFSATFRPVSFEEEDDDEPINWGICRFKSSTPTPSGHGHSWSGHSPAFSSNPQHHGGHFILSSNWKELPSSSLGAPPLEGKNPGLRPLDEDLDAGLEANNEDNGEKDQGESEDPNIDAAEIKILRGIINPGTHDQVPALPKSGEKWGSCHLKTSIDSDSSAEDLDAKDAWPKKKVLMPVKEASSNIGQWTNEDLEVVHQIHYKTNLDRFQTYRCNKITPADLSIINNKDHSAYIDIAKSHPGTVIKKSVFSIATYQQVLWLKGSDTSKFYREVRATFKKSAKGSRAPDTERVAIDRIMLMYQHENGVDMAYSDLDSFGHPGMMDLWNLYSSDTLSRAKMQLVSSWVDANFCPMCLFWSTNNKTFNNHVHKHYQMGLTCHSGGFTTASVAAMKAHMEAEHGYEGKSSAQVKKQKGKAKQCLARCCPSMDLTHHVLQWLQLHPTSFFTCVGVCWLTIVCGAKMQHPLSILRD